MQDWKLEPARDLGLDLGDRLRSYRREAGLVESVAHLVWWNLVHGYLRLCHHLKVDGVLPTEPPFVLIANHQSHLDALVLAAPLPARLRDRIFPIAAGDTFFSSGGKAIFAAGLLNALPMWRGKCVSHALQELRHRLVEEPCAYILFPEGTRSREGKLAPFKPGLGMLVAGTAVPVVPCYLDGTFEALPAHRSLPRFHPIVMRVGRPLVFAEVSNDRAGWVHIARQCEAAVQALSPGKVSSPAERKNRESQIENSAPIC